MRETLCVLGLRALVPPTNHDGSAAHGLSMASLEAGSEAHRAARTALFSLGNIAGHRQCHDALKALDLPTALAPLEAHADTVLRDHAARVLAKVSMHST